VKGMGAESFPLPAIENSKINIHPQSGWFFTCGHSPLFLAMRRTHLYGLPVAWEMFLLFFAIIYPITYFAFYLPHFFLLHSNENSIFLLAIQLYL
jgi:hypothetical protein